MMKDLIKVLEQEISICEKLHNVLEREKQSVISHNLDMFTEAGKEKEALFSLLEEAESTRLAIVKQAESDPEGSSFAAEEMQKICMEIEDRKKRLFEIISRIHDMSNNNLILINNALSLVKESIAFLKDVASDESVYQSTGNSKKSAPVGKFLSKDI